MWLALVLGTALGTLIGITGAGGGVLAVPALVFGLGLSMQQAAPVALLAVCAGSAMGALQAWRSRLVRYRAAILMAVASLPFAALGQQAALYLPQFYLMLFFAMVMFLVAWRLLRRPEAEKTMSRWVSSVYPETGRLMWTGMTAQVLILIGACAGATTGLLGVGGGVVVVPLLRRFTTLGMHAIVGTTLMVVALISGLTFVLAMLRGLIQLDGLTLFFSGSALLGGFAGRQLSGRMSAQAVQQSFAWVVLVVAVLLLWAAL